MKPPCIPHIPTSYEARAAKGLTVWHASDESLAHLDALTGLAEESLTLLEKMLSFRGIREIHLCCYRSNAEARRSLDRDVPASMALAPFSNRQHGLVVVQSPDAAPENADSVRMLRILVHEFAHLLTMEATGSRKRLGDENREMTIPAWLFEGIAEVCGLRAVERERAFARCLRSVAQTQEVWTFSEVSARLEDLNSRERAAAFDRATGAVAWLAAWEGLDRILDRASVWIRVLPSSLDCSIPILCRAIGTGSARR